MNVHITPELERMVHGKVQTGRYNSASEVIREALRLMEERDQVKTIHGDELRKKIADGLQSLEEGCVFDTDEVFAEMQADLEDFIDDKYTAFLNDCSHPPMVSSPGHLPPLQASLITSLAELCRPVCAPCAGGGY